MESIIRIKKEDVEFITCPPTKKLFEEYDYFIFDQGHNLSCPVTSPISMIEYLRQKEGKKCEKFSVGFLYHSSLINEGKNKISGLKATTVIKTLLDNGTCLQEKWSSENNFKSEPTYEAVLDALTRIKHCNIECIDNDLETIKYIIGFCERPAVTIFNMIDEDVFSLENSKTIIQPGPIDSEIVNRHSVLLVGYDDEEQVIYFQNSYGPSWGFNGFGKFSYSCISRFQLIYSMDESCLKGSDEELDELEF